MNSKKYSQFGTFIVIIFAPLFIFFTTMIFTYGLKEKETLIPFSIVSLIIFIALLFFYKLTIIIDDTYISFKLGIGLFGKKYRIDDLKSCKPVKNSIFFGIGAKMLPNGWLFNVSGLKAIELSFKNKKSIIRIGTDKPEEIADIVSKLINHDSPFIEDTKAQIKSNKRLITFIFICLIILLIPIALIFYGNQEIKIKLNKDNFEIKGIYGITIKYNEISQIDTLSKIPKIEFKNNGYAFGKICKGNFRLNGISNAKLFINCGFTPYLHLRLLNKYDIFINFK